MALGIAVGGAASDRRNTPAVRGLLGEDGGAVGEFDLGVVGVQRDGAHSGRLDAKAPDRGLTGALLLLFERLDRGRSQLRARGTCGVGLDGVKKARRHALDGGPIVLAVAAAPQ